MDFQDILFFLIFFVFSVLPKKKKTDVFDEPIDDQTEQVRKKIEALKRKRNKADLEEVHTHLDTTKTSPSSTPPKKDFSAYKHPLPVYEQPAYAPQVIIQQPSLAQTKTTQPKCASSTLREGMKWHIILSKPVCTQSFYGNFTNR